jgi:2'-5' RNA ligase/ribosomal protein S18 acetylase RimI-like enzyme
MFEFEGMLSVGRFKNALLFRQAVPDKYKHINFQPPESVAKVAEKGLEYRQKASPSNKGGLTSEEAGKEGIGSGVQRAVNLKNRDNIAPDTIKQMHGFFSRHQKNKGISEEHKGEPWNDKGYVSWLLWGGDPGFAWVKKVLKQMEAADKKAAAAKKKEAAAFRPGDIPDVVFQVRRTRYGKGGYTVVAFRDGQYLGNINFSIPLGMGECHGAYEVTQSWADERGLGPLLYDIAMELAGPAGLMSDRREVSPDARRIWNYYDTSRPDVKKKQLDTIPGVLTPGTEDDCRQPGFPGTNKVYWKSSTPVLDDLKALGMIRFAASKQAGLLEPPPKMLAEMYQWAVASWAKTRMAKGVAEGMGSDNATWQEWERLSKLHPDAVELWSPVQKRFDADLRGWKYGDRLQELIEQENADLLRKLQPPEGPVPDYMRLYIEKMKRDILQGAKKPGVNLILSDTRGRRSAEFDPRTATIEVEVSPKADPDWIYKALRHEMRHYAQNLLSTLAGYASDKIQAGLPSRRIQTPDIRQQGQNRSQHSLDDREFYTKLPDAIDRMREELGALPPEERVAAFRILVGQRRHDTRTYPIAFFYDLKRAGSPARGKYQKAIGEAYKAVSDLFPSKASRQLRATWFKGSREFFESDFGEPKDAALWSKALKMAEEKHPKMPARFHQGWAAKWYKEKGGEWTGETMNVKVGSGGPLPTGEKTFMDGQVYEMNLAADEFVHFTTAKRAASILRSKKLLLDPPGIKKFGGYAVYAISLVWGEFVPGTQTTHIDKDEGPLVAIRFQTDTMPKPSYSEEVTWNQDVALKNPKLMTKQQAVGLLNSASYRLGDQDLVRYVRGKRAKSTREERLRGYAPWSDDYAGDGIILTLDQLDLKPAFDYQWELLKELRGRKESMYRLGGLYEWVGLQYLVSGRLGGVPRKLAEEALKVIQEIKDDPSFEEYAEQWRDPSKFKEVLRLVEKDLENRLKDDRLKKDNKVFLIDRLDQLSEEPIKVTYGPGKKRAGSWGVLPWEGDRTGDLYAEAVSLIDASAAEQFLLDELAHTIQLDPAPYRVSSLWSWLGSVYRFSTALQGVSLEVADAALAAIRGMQADPGYEDFLSSWRSYSDIRDAVDAVRENIQESIARAGEDSVVRFYQAPLEHREKKAGMSRSASLHPMIGESKEDAAGVPILYSNSWELVTEPDYGASTAAMPRGADRASIEEHWFYLGALEAGRETDGEKWAHQAKVAWTTSSGARMEGEVLKEEDGVLILAVEGEEQTLKLSNRVEWVFEVPWDGPDPWKIADQAGINILSGKDFKAGLAVGGELVAVLFDEVSGDCYSFDVAVRPDKQKQGLGAKLMDYAIDEYDSLQEAFDGLKFCLDAVNPHAIRMLKRRGFVETGRERGHTFMSRRAFKPQSRTASAKKAEDSPSYMSVQHLAEMADHAQELSGKIDSDTPLPDWVESKLSQAAQVLRDVYEYLEHGAPAEATGAPVTAAVPPPDTSVGLFIPLPEDLAAQYPTKSEDPSPAHVTFLYVGSVPEEREEEFKILCTQVFSEVRGPIRAALRGLDRFLSPEQKVIFSRVRFSRDLNRARDLLRTRLESAGFEVKDSFPRWNPHVTIAYVPVDAEVKVEAPVGTWDFDSIQVWGMGDPENIPLGSSPGFEPSQTPTQDAERLASIQAMRELSLRWSQL